MRFHVIEKLRLTEEFYSDCWLATYSGANSIKKFIKIRVFLWKSLKST